MIGFIDYSFIYTYIYFFSSWFSFNITLLRIPTVESYVIRREFYYQMVGKAKVKQKESKKKKNLTKHMIDQNNMWWVGIWLWVWWPTNFLYITYISFSLLLSFFLVPYYTTPYIYVECWIDKKMRRFSKRITHKRNHILLASFFFLIFYQGRQRWPPIFFLSMSPRNIIRFVFQYNLLR